MKSMDVNEIGFDLVRLIDSLGGTDETVRLIAGDKVGVLMSTQLWQQINQALNLADAE